MMLDRALRAIAEPRRREILDLLLPGDELSAGEIASRFSLTRPAISQHLGILMDAGLVDVQRRGTRRFYRAKPAGLAELRRYLDTFWDAGLIRLKAAVEADMPAVADDRNESSRDEV
ncbi:MAG: metalloregulator ArsR/SmtB family transcription factor [Chloroflexi bacterium]|nr:metalloregulator ArsR/SmtB family transcription factor [Chloroflexota bacterium]